MTNSYVQVPPDSTGKKLFTQEHIVDANTVQAQVIHIADKTTPSNALAIDIQGAASVRFSEGQPTLSGFGALNVTQPSVLGVYESSSGPYDDLFSITSVTGGTSVYDDTGHGTILTTTGSNGSSIKRTTNRYHYYLPGSSNIVVMTTACGDTGKANNLRRWGAFDSQDGVMFELYESTVNVVVRSSTTGSVVDTKIPQADWNIDKLNGAGTSGMTLDVTKINIWWIDYQWLGSGRVRFGVFAKDGSRVVCHIVENAGQYVVPYMRSGTLPLSTENTNFGATGSSSQLRESCLAIYSEGKISEYTFWRSSDVDAVGTTVTASDTLLFALHSKTTVPELNHHNSVIAYPETLNVYSDQPVRIDIWQDVTATGGVWGLTSADSTIDGSTDTVVSDLVSPWKTLFFPAGVTSIDITKYFEVNDEGILLNADTTYQVWAFTAKRLGSTNASVTVNLGYRELY